MDAIACNEETLTSSELDELLAARSPLSFWRKRRRLTQAQLSAAAGIAQGFLSEIEGGRKTGDLKTLKRIAAALDISLLDLVDEPPARESPRPRPRAAKKV